MRVFKFGGASVKTAESVANVVDIIKSQNYKKLVVIVSAMGKTTNKLEEIVDAKFNDNHTLLDSLLKDLIYCHLEIVRGLFTNNLSLEKEVSETFMIVNKTSVDVYDELYDQIVCLGELVSTKIISEYAQQNGVSSCWVDARDSVITDSKFRNGTVEWDRSVNAIQKQIDDCPYDVCFTQGFIGGNAEGKTVSLGREGSDYSGAIFAFALNAEDLTIWKDVPGMLNADPRYFEDTRKLDQNSYEEAIELSYYGASVIHPKTVQPLKQKNIPLYVKSFVKPEDSGSVIQYDTSSDSFIPSYIFKQDQVLAKIETRDFSFVAEEHLSQIFGIFDKAGLKINIMQNSAIRFTAMVDFDEVKYDRLQVLFNDSDFELELITNLELLTVRHYNESILKKLIGNKEVLLEQRNTETARFILS
jgi:aspartate kinase